MASVNFCSCSWVRLSTHQKASCGSCPGWQWGQFTPGHYFLWLPFGKGASCQHSKQARTVHLGSEESPWHMAFPYFPLQLP